MEIKPNDYKISRAVIDIFVYDNPQNLSLEELNKQLTGPSGMGPDLFSSNSKKVKLQSNFTADYSNCSIDGRAKKCEQYVVLYKNKVFSIRNVIGEDDVIVNQQKVYDQILSTFKFTDQNLSLTNGNFFYIIKNLYKSDNQGRQIPNTTDMDLVMDLPENVVIDQQKQSISADKIRYSVKMDTRMQGLCPWEDDGSGCVYSDKVLNNIPTFRIWADKRGVFALNPQSIKIDGYLVDYFVIRKETPNNIFSKDEIDLWENWLKGLKLVSSSNQKI